MIPFGLEPETLNLPNSPDFPNRMNPLLLMELRTALRSGVFVMSFVMLQLGLFLVVGIQVLEVGSGMPVPSVSWTFLFWVQTILLFHVLLPFRTLFTGLAAVAANRADLLSSTGVSVRHLSAHKWASHCILVVVTFLAFLPYMLVRYFLAGMNVAGEICGTMWIFGSALVLGAPMVLAGTFKLTGRIVSAVILLVSLHMFENWTESILTGTPQLESIILCGCSWAAFSLIIVVASLGLASLRFDPRLEDMTEDETWE